ncbi:tripartite tricarboxylate transporter permease [Paenirhodobacter populi]|uniref:Tripartite tricarboxylate transporter permease n=1 Tax=Paenirhodobacter populi TaxID=2306993 RepID=A0A443KCV2_9RHOB|nr:tripartite tricarboxylate transporter permease [Sinirhodobacter populi]RWR04965.1 tripartite tricarboxylate transporter permease [Sinirhodobacter populi]RWR13282.1 tripartite tricarboxylate transporter permease [Sinirhodobacter populi]RWR24499.1 tripartite tricarboxylate transporter permease [Sinirhodobacter populi]RWR29244.1 tripartite tricarboxylate transporter permease [Sinirhodobacter populi]RWR30618.1 tripartite tricarboxylate transporter permease [Sinirhodobacter populi]
MDFMSNLALGFSVASTMENLAFCLIGALLGTLIGVLPGIGATATIAMLLPITFQLEPVSSLIMLAGIYYGAQYGGSTTAILINMPGESSSAVTAIDGYQMARQGRAGAALAVAAIGSFFAGTVATFLVAIFAPPLTTIALKFGSAEYFSLLVLGLIMSVALAHGSVLKALAMVVLGLLLGMVGNDVYEGTPRFTMGITAFADGLNFVALAVGVFGIAEILRNLENEHDRAVVTSHVGRLWPSRTDFRAMIAPILRGTGLGAVLGILPGGGAILASFASYTVEKRLSKNPKEFGHGAIAGVAGPESANNAGAQTSFIPLLTLGIPANPVMALMIGAMIIQGIVPGPNVAIEQPGLFWGVIASMWIGNLMLVILNLPLIGLWVKLLTVPYFILFPIIMAMCAIGVYSVNSNIYDLYAVAFFGLLGYVMGKLRFEPAPLLLGFVLGPLLEEHLRRAMILSRGDPMTFVTRPISLTLLVLACIVLVLVLVPAVRRNRAEVFTESEV